MLGLLTKGGIKTTEACLVFHFMPLWLQQIGIPRIAKISWIENHITANPFVGLIRIFQISINSNFFHLFSTRL